jgi:hypothetical protein
MCYSFRLVRNSLFHAVSTEVRRAPDPAYDRHR